MENKSVTPAAQVLAPAVSEIRSLLEVSRKNVTQQVNQELLSTYWKIGEVLVRYEQNDSIRAAYGEKTLPQLSKVLTKELGKGFSRSNLQNMRLLYLNYPICQTLSGKLKRQIESSLFERLLLSCSDANKEKVLALAEKGVDYTKPEDIIKDPYVFEFLGMPEEKPFLESDLEAALVRQIEDFLLELGRGFMFVGTQQRVTVNNTHYYVDMVFYNKILHAYVLIELKTTKLTPEAAGQINMYLKFRKKAGYAHREQYGGGDDWKGFCRKGFRGERTR